MKCAKFHQKCDLGTRSAIFGTPPLPPSQKNAWNESFKWSKHILHRPHIFLHKCTFRLNFSPHLNRGKNCINFASMATFSTSDTCHMWRISDFSTSVMWRHRKFLHMWRNFQFPYNYNTWKAEISPHDNFFSTNIIRDKYQVCSISDGIYSFIGHAKFQYKQENNFQYQFSNKIYSSNNQFCINRHKTDTS